MTLTTIANQILSLREKLKRYPEPYLDSLTYIKDTTASLLNEKGDNEELAELFPLEKINTIAQLCKNIEDALLNRLADEVFVEEWRTLTSMSQSMIILFSQNMHLDVMARLKPSDVSHMNRSSARMFFPMGFNHHDFVSENEELIEIIKNKILLEKSIDKTQKEIPNKELSKTVAKI